MNHPQGDYYTSPTETVAFSTIIDEDDLTSKINTWLANQRATLNVYSVEVLNIHYQVTTKVGNDKKAWSALLLYQVTTRE